MSILSNAGLTNLNIAASVIGTVLMLLAWWIRSFETDNDHRKGWDMVVFNIAFLLSTFAWGFALMDIFVGAKESMLEYVLFFSTVFTGAMGSWEAAHTWENPKRRNGATLYTVVGIICSTTNFFIVG